MRARIYQPAKTAMQSGTAKAKGWVAVPNIMVPLVGCVKEFETQVMCC